MNVKYILSVVMFLLVMSCNMNANKQKTTAKTARSSVEKLEMKVQKSSDLFDKVMLMRQLAAEKLKTLKPQQANNYFEDFRRQIDALLHKINEQESHYLMNCYKYRHDEDGNATTPPDSILKKEERIKNADLLVRDLGEGMFEIGLTNSFYKILFAEKITFDYRAYLALKEAEGGDAIVQDAFLVISQKELADLVLKYEDFISKYPDSKQLKEVRTRYKELQNIYLLGVDNSPIIDDSKGVLYAKAKKEFQRFVEAYPKSPTSKLINVILAEKQIDYSTLYNKIEQLQNQ